MTSIQKLTATDFLKLKRQTKMFWLQHFLFLICATIISLVSGLFGLKSFDYWICVGATFSFLIVLYLIMFTQEFIAFRKDIKQQQKVCTTLMVTNKSTKKNDFVFYSNLKKLRKVNLFNRKTYEQVAIGDQLYVEFTKQGKQLLRLEKDGHNLLEDIDRPELQ